MFGVLEIVRSRRDGSAGSEAILLHSCVEDLSGISVRIRSAVCERTGRI